MSDLEVETLGKVLNDLEQRIGYLEAASPKAGADVIIEIHRLIRDQEARLSAYEIRHETQVAEAKASRNQRDQRMDYLHKQFEGISQKLHEVSLRLPGEPAHYHPDHGPTVQLLRDVGKLVRAARALRNTFAMVNAPKDRVDALDEAIKLFDGDCL